MNVHRLKFRKCRTCCSWKSETCPINRQVLMQPIPQTVFRFLCVYCVQFSITRFLPRSTVIPPTYHIFISLLAFFSLAEPSLLLHSGMASHIACTSSDHIGFLTPQLLMLVCTHPHPQRHSQRQITASGWWNICIPALICNIIQIWTGTENRDPELVLRS